MNNNFLIQDQFEEIEVEEINSKISKNWKFVNSQKIDCFNKF